MSVAQEFFQPDYLPMAAISATQGIVAIGGVLSATIAAKSLGSHVHRTIDRGHMGVWLDRGQPRIKDNITDEDIANENDYVVEGPGSYWFRPIAVDLRDVNVAPRSLALTPETAPPIRAITKEGTVYTTYAEILWRVKPKGNNPVKSITNVETNKDALTNNANKDIELERAVRAQGRASFGKAITGVPTAKLEKMNTEYLAELTVAVVEDSKERLKRLGSEILAVLVDPFTPVDAEILAEGMRRSGERRISRQAMAAVAQAANEVGVGAEVIVGNFAGWGKDDAAA
jgi:hypothetical protein